MSLRRRPARRGVLVAALVVVSSCGGADGSSAPTSTATPSAPASTAATPSTSMADAATTTDITVTTSMPTTTSTAAPPASPDPGPCLQRWPVDHVAAQLVWPAVSGEALAAQAEQFADWHVGGALLMTWPASASADQLAAFKSAGEVPLLVGTDEEGGQVQRFRSLGLLPAASDLASVLTPEQAERAVATHAQLLAGVGIDVVFAPVADVGPAVGVGPMQDRVFSSEPDVVASYAAAYARAWQGAGILPVLKHFPGHGAAGADSHDGIAATAPLDELEQRDLVPYSQLLAEATVSPVGVMVGHLDVSGLTDGLPASLSAPAITGLLRDHYGFDGLVFTDDLNMGAVTARFSTPDASVRAVVAGADVVLLGDPAATPDVVAALVDAVGSGVLPRQRLDAAALAVLAQKDIDPCDH